MNIERRKIVFDYLEKLGIDYNLTEHPALNTIEDTKEYWRLLPGAKCKNLFFRNNKGNKHFLLVLKGDKQVDIKALNKLLEQRLSFASDKRLDKYLGLTPGSVSAFGLINDINNEVLLLIDKDALSKDYINFHPNDNTATISLKTEDFKRYLKEVGNSFSLIDLQ